MHILGHWQREPGSHPAQLTLYIIIAIMYVDTEVTKIVKIYHSCPSVNAVDQRPHGGG